MIFLTKLDKSRVLVAIESIKLIESTPDTLIRFVNGDMLIVLETQEEIASEVVRFKSRCLGLASDRNATGSIGNRHETAAN
jgi:uncharacterized protein YlzI (FlbEa/FlbD family)